MRRSAAPSQQNATKRIKFTVPYKDTSSSSENKKMTGRNSGRQLQDASLTSSLPPSEEDRRASALPLSEETTLDFHFTVKASLEAGSTFPKETRTLCADSLNLKADISNTNSENSQTSTGLCCSSRSVCCYQGGHINKEEQPACLKQRANLKNCQMPLISKTNLCLPVSPSRTKGETEATEKCRINSNDTKLQHCNLDALGSDAANCSVKKGYFSVVWCKLSKKKHKKWEGDAILLTHGRCATLYDMDGKEIGRGSGYKSSELESLKEDESLMIGGKQIQVMSALSEEQYRSGKCFLGAQSTAENCTTSSVSLKSAGTCKSFTNPLLTSHNKANTQADIRQTILLPRFDPSAPGALVMPRPDMLHQVTHNRHQLAVVDVVVDPHLSVHLRPHQREGVVFLYECISAMRGYAGTGAILADDMGLGKTLQCITLIWTLLKQGPYGGKPVLKRVMIITPGSLVKNWSQEFRKWLGPERIHVFVVAGDKKIEDYTKTTLCPVMIISYEMFLRGYEVIKKVPFDLIVCDEGHRLKNTAIKTTALIMSLETRRRIVLSGTPVQNDLQEFFSVVEFCNPGVLGSSAAFRHVYEMPILASQQPNATREQQELGEQRACELAKITQMFILRRTQEINNKYLPPKVELVLFCHPSILQQRLYKEVLQTGVVRSCLMGCDLRPGLGSGSFHLQAIAALRQLCNHPVLLAAKIKTACAKDPDVQDEKDKFFACLRRHYCNKEETGSQLKSDDSGKLAVLEELLKTLFTLFPEEKVVLVSNHTKTLDMLQQFCGNLGYKSVRLDGQTPTVQRQEIVNRFNSTHGVESIFLLSSKAGGVGLNLVGASRLVLFDIDWNPANDLQAMARVWRDGQKRKVFIYRLLTTGSIEEKVYQRQISKQGLSGTVIDLKATDIQFSQEDLKDLFSFNTSTECDTHTLLDCLCNGEQSTQSESIEPVETSSQCLHQDSSITSAGKQMASGMQARNLSMSELLDWKHLKGSSLQFQKEWCLGDRRNIPLSFLFWNET